MRGRYCNDEARRVVAPYGIRRTDVVCIVGADVLNRPGGGTWSGPGGVCWTVRRAAEDGGPYGDRVHFRCRGGYHPPGVLSSAPSSVSLRSPAPPLWGEAFKTRPPSLPHPGGKVAIWEEDEQRSEGYGAGDDDVGADVLSRPPSRRFT